MNLPYSHSEIAGIAIITLLTLLFLLTNGLFYHCPCIVIRYTIYGCFISRIFYRILIKIWAEKIK